MSSSTALKRPTFKSSRPLVRLALDFMRPYRAVVVLIMALMVVEAALTGTMAYSLETVVNTLFPPPPQQRDPQMAMLVPLALVVIMTLKAAVSYVSNVSLSKVGQGVVSDLQVAMFAKVACYDLTRLNAMHSGQFSSRFLNDALVVRESVTKSIQALVRDSLTVVGLGVVMFIQDWVLALILCTALPATAIFTLNLGSKTKKAATKSMASTGDLAMHLSETLDGRRVVKAYQLEKHAIERATDIVTQRMVFILKGARARAAATPGAEVLAGIGIGAVIFYASYRGMDVASFTAFSAAMMLSYQSIRSLSGLYTALSEGSAAAARSYALLDATNRIVDASDTRLSLSPDQRGPRVAFKDVRFEYEGTGQAALNGTSFTVMPGQTVALVGPSGAGKSTILNLILRFYDVNGGAIEVDGQDVRHVTMSSLRDAMALVTQEPFLFDESIFDNIVCGKPGATQDEVEAAARTAAAHDFIQTLPQGYRTRVGEAGVRLSGGQRQRIAIARAILKDAPILLLDEATSSLDNESERAVQLALSKLMQNRTTIVIAHRLSTIADADKIVVLDHGAVAEQGTHAELLARNGVYARLYHAQYSEKRPDFAAVAE